MKPDTLEDLFKSQLGESFEMNGSTTWEQIEQKRKSKPKPIANRKIKIIAISVIMAGVCAAALHRFVLPSSPMATKEVTKTQYQNAPKSYSASIVQPIDSPATITESIIEEKQHPIISQKKTANTEEPQAVVPTTDSAVAISPLTPSALTVDSLKHRIGADSILDKPKPIKTVVVVQKQSVIVKDTTVTTVKKRMRRRL